MIIFSRLHDVRRAASKALPLLFHLPQVVTLHRALQSQGINLLPRSPHPWTRGIQAVSRQGLSRSFSLDQRLEALGCHLGYSDRLTKLAEKLKDVPLVPERPIALNLKRASETLEEGLSVLEYCFDGRVLYRATFTIVPGRIVGREGACLFLGGSQGLRDQRAAIRLASLAYHDLSPMSFTFLALQAIAQALNLKGIVAVGVGQQVSSSLAERKDHSLYDQLWLALGGENTGDFYELPLIPKGKDLSSLSHSHRRRARMRQKAKWALFFQIGAVLENSHNENPSQGTTLWTSPWPETDVTESASPLRSTR